MKHEIDLKKYEIRTDLAIETLEQNKEVNGAKITTKDLGDIKITQVKLNKKGGISLNKKPGTYITIEFKDITDKDNKEKVLHLFIHELKKLVKLPSKESYVLIIGLGNEASTPDSLGPLTVKDIIVTNHLYELATLDSNYQRVSAISPGVMGETGIETSDIIQSIVDKIKPDLVIVIDSLASGSIDRVNKTIQMTDTGIHPGSGIGNERKEISFDTLKVPVIAIGVPTVVDAVTIVSDTINYMYRNYSYTKENKDKPKYKLIVGGVNYLKEPININDNDKRTLLGLVGTLNETEVKNLIAEVLTPIGYNLMVTPKEVDFVIKGLSEILAQGINRTLHKIN